jgi:hypothetical protein
MPSCDLRQKSGNSRQSKRRSKDRQKPVQAPTNAGPVINFKIAKALAPDDPLLVNHPIGAQQKRFRNLDADHVGGFEVDE